MLVHVSPKEEDLCETICSLNFATRVKGVHLGNEGTIVSRQTYLFKIVLVYITLVQRKAQVLGPKTHKLTS